MSVEVRIKAALQGSGYKPNPNGDSIVEADIPSNGLDIDEVRDHDLVEDVFENDDGSYHVYVNAESEQQVFVAD
jgi:hypothetical protein